MNPEEGRPLPVNTKEGAAIPVPSLEARPLPLRLLNSLAAMGPLKAALLMLAVATLLRSASLFFPVMDIDEAHWTLIGRMILDGGVPYVDFTDHKPPLLFYLYAGWVAVTGGNLAAIHGIMLLWITITAWFIRLATRDLTGSNAAGVMGAWAYVILSSANVMTANSELIMNLPLALALYLAALGLKGRSVHLFSAGLCIGLAALIRLQAGVALAAVLFCLAWLRLRRGRRSWLREGALCALGFAFPLLITAGLFAAFGYFPPFWEWNITRNLGYPPPKNWGLLMVQGLAAFALGAQGWAWFLSGRPLGRALKGLWKREGDGPPDPHALLGAMLLLLSCLAVFMGRRFYSHYFVQLALPLAFFIGPPLARLRLRVSEGRKGKDLSAILAVALVSVLAFSAISWFRGAKGHYPGQDPKVRSVAAFLNSAKAPPGRILLWGDSSPIYYYSARLPATRYYNAAPLVGNFDTNHVPDGFDFQPYLNHRDIMLWLDDARRNKAALVVDTSDGPIHFWHRFPMKKVAPIWDYVRRHFKLLASVPGGSIYGRKGR